MFKRTTLVALLVGLVGFACTTGAIAADKPVRLAGLLVEINGKSLTIANSPDDVSKNIVITCNDKTKFRRDADNTWVKLADIKLGQTVRVYYTNPHNIATLVNIAKPGSK